MAKKAGKHKRGGQIAAAEFDRKFDSGEDVSAYVDWSRGARYDPRRIVRVTIDFPEEVVAEIDREAARLGVTREELVITWVAERLKKDS